MLTRVVPLVPAAPRDVSLGARDGVNFEGRRAAPAWRTRKVDSGRPALAGRRSAASHFETPLTRFLSLVLRLSQQCPTGAWEIVLFMRRSSGRFAENCEPEGWCSVAARLGLPSRARHHSEGGVSAPASSPSALLSPSFRLWIQTTPSLLPAMSLHGHPLHGAIGRSAEGQRTDGLSNHPGRDL